MLLRGAALDIDEFSMMSSPRASVEACASKVFPKGDASALATSRRVERLITGRSTVLVCVNEEVTGSSRWVDRQESGANRRGDVSIVVVQKSCSAFWGCDSFVRGTDVYILGRCRALRPLSASRRFTRRGEGSHAAPGAQAYLDIIMQK